MARNIEIKARIASVEALAPKVAAIADQGPKESFYILSPTNSPETLREALSLAYGQAGRVLKRRTLYLVGRTRVHLDRVEGLGHFLELEVVLKDDEAAEAGTQVAQGLMAKLGVEAEQLVQGAYNDLLNRAARSGA
ncbi:MAG: class IV adenylate cyclase [Elusimicrobia bacterium]|nr:class IV adenylate cyclase [Elusimicrobiota bacterium]